MDSLVPEELVYLKPKLLKLISIFKENDKEKHRVEAITKMNKNEVALSI